MNLLIKLCHCILYMTLKLLLVKQLRNSRINIAYACPIFLHVYLPYDGFQLCSPMLFLHDPIS